MSAELIHNRGRGPEIFGTRITVYNLLPYFLDPAETEAGIAKLYGLTVEQVAAARAYALNHVEAVLARHREIEARLAVGNPPEVIEQGKRTHERFVQFKEWLAHREQTEGKRQPSKPSASEAGSAQFPTFHEWLAQQPSHTSERL